MGCVILKPLSGVSNWVGFCLVFKGKLIKKPTILDTPAAVPGGVSIRVSPAVALLAGGSTTAAISFWIKSSF